MSSSARARQLTSQAWKRDTGNHPGALFFVIRSGAPRASGARPDEKEVHYGTAFFFSGSGKGAPGADSARSGNRSPGFEIREGQKTATRSEKPVASLYLICSAVHKLGASLRLAPARFCGLYSGVGSSGRLGELAWRSLRRVPPKRSYSSLSSPCRALAPARTRLTMFHSA